MSDFETIVLWRPVGPVELELIKQLKMRAFPPRLLGACPGIERILLAKDERVGFHLAA